MSTLKNEEADAAAAASNTCADIIVQAVTDIERDRNSTAITVQTAVLEAYRRGQRTRVDDKTPVVPAQASSDTADTRKMPRLPRGSGTQRKQR